MSTDKFEGIVIVGFAICLALSFGTFGCKLGWHLAKRAYLRWERRHIRRANVRLALWTQDGFGRRDHTVGCDALHFGERS